MDTELNASIDVIEAHLSHRLNCETSLVDYVRSLLRRSETMRVENRALACCLALSKEKASRVLNLQAAAMRKMALINGELKSTREAHDLLIQERDELEVKNAQLESALRDMERNLMSEQEANADLKVEYFFDLECRSRTNMMQTYDERLNDITANFARESLRSACGVPSHVSQVTHTGPRESELLDQEKVEKEKEELVAKMHEMEQSMQQLRNQDSANKRRIAKLETELSLLRQEKQQQAGYNGASPTADSLRASSSDVVSLTPTRVLTKRPQRYGQSLGRSLSRVHSVDQAASPKPQPQVQPRIPPPPARAISPAQKNGVVFPAGSKSAQLASILHQLRKDGLSEAPVSRAAANDGQKLAKSRVGHSSSVNIPSADPERDVQTRLFPKTLSKSPSRRPNLSPQPACRKALQTGFKSASDVQ